MGRTIQLEELPIDSLGYNGVQLREGDKYCKFKCKHYEEEIELITTGWYLSFASYLLLEEDLADEIYVPLSLIHGEQGESVTYAGDTGVACWDMAEAYVELFKDNIDALSFDSYAMDKSEKALKRAGRLKRKLDLLRVAEDIGVVGDKVICCNPSDLGVMEKCDVAFGGGLTISKDTTIEMDILQHVDFVGSTRTKPTLRIKAGIVADCSFEGLNIVIEPKADICKVICGVFDKCSVRHEGGIVIADPNLVQSEMYLKKGRYTLYPCFTEDIQEVE